MKAAQSSTAEIQLGKLAAHKGTDPAVKALGQQMVDDHTRAADQLRALARERKMTLPSLGSARDQAAYDKLKGLQGADFDAAYLAQMLKAHEMAIKQFQTEADKGKDPIIRNFASQTLPVLQSHLEKIKDLSKAPAAPAK